MSEKLNCKLDCLDSTGEVCAIIEISSDNKEEPERLPPKLLVLSEEDAININEHSVQLRENAQYLCRISNPDGTVANNLRLSPNPLIQNRKFEGDKSFTIQTKSSAGTLSLQVIDELDNLFGRALVEIRSVKLDYKKEYRGMVCGITEKAKDLLFQLGGSTQVAMQDEWSQDEPTLVQQIEFLRALLYNHDLWNSLDKLLRSPHEKLDLEPEIVPITRVGSSGREITRQLASSQPRINLPINHRLRNRISSLPTRVTVKSKIRSYDTPENRFIKYAIREFSTFLEHIIETLKKLPEAENKRRYEIVSKDCTDLKKEFDRRLGAGFFKSIAEPKVLPFGSAVLQKKAGYREVFQTWLGFRASSMLNWEGSEDVFGGGNSKFDAGKKDLPTLYEAWIFFELLDLFKEKFEVNEDDLNKFIKPNGKLGEFTLKQGVVKSFKGHNIQGLGINGLLEYNRSFKSSENHQESSSWTRVLRPDYTMTFWPAKVSLKEAEKIGSSVHVHFDAKYRVENIDQLFGKPDSSEHEVTQEKKEEKEGNYKKADLLKMHAYRDAIRRSEGAYVLYPGKIESSTKEELQKKENRRWKGFHELLPGLGAFALRPDSTGRAIGIEHVSEFLDEVISQYSNRASHLAHTRYGNKKVIDHSSYRVEESEKISLTNKLFDEISPQKEDLTSGQETTVLGGMIKNESHLNWVKTEKIYNFRFDKDRAGYLPTLIPEFPKAKFLFLYRPNGEPVNGLFKITGYYEKSQAELLEMSYPSPEGEWYLCFEIETIIEETEWSWEKLKKINETLRPSYRNKKPFQMSLNQLLSILDK